MGVGAREARDNASILGCAQAHSRAIGHRAKGLHQAEQNRSRGQNRKCSEFQLRISRTGPIRGLRLPVGGAVANCTRLVKVPVLTNSTALAPGDELILELTIEAKEKTPTKRTWRDVDKEEATDRKRRRDWRLKDTPDLAASVREADWLTYAGRLASRSRGICPTAVAATVQPQSRSSP